MIFILHVCSFDSGSRAKQTIVVIPIITVIPENLPLIEVFNQSSLHSEALFVTFCRMQILIKGDQQVQVFRVLFVGHKIAGRNLQKYISLTAGQATYKVLQGDYTVRSTL